MRSYIVIRYGEDGFFEAKLSQNGKYRIVKDPKNFLALYDIASMYGYSADRKIKIVKNADEIINAYDEYKRRKRQKNSIFGVLEEKCKLIKKSKVGKSIAAISLAGTLTISAIAISNSIKTEDPDVLGGRIQVSRDETKDEQSKEISDIIEDDEQTDTESEVSIDEESSKDVSVEELSTIFDRVKFHYNYEDRSNSSNIDRVNEYDDIFQKYAKMYGLDVRLLKAIACQETGGDHYGNIEDGPACGIMQIEKSVHIGQTISAYSPELGEMTSVDITEEKLKDIDFNIKVGAMDLRNAMESFSYNIPQATQAYNFGTGGMNRTLALCCDKDLEMQYELEKTPSNNSWLDYREQMDSGDKKYIEHVFSYLPNNTTLNVLDRNGKNHEVTLTNDYQKEYSTRL